MSDLKTISKKKKSVGELSRIIGSVQGSEGGRTVVMLAGMHGNEPSGVEALQNIMSILQEASLDFKGRLAGIRANISALQKGVRYIDEDMNRIWFPSILDKIRETRADKLKSSERVEIKSVLPILDRIISQESDKPAIIVDLHSFSAEGCMFAITADKKEHTDLLSSLHIPMIFGIENTLRGTALRYYQDLDYITIGLEGGQHENSLTVYNMTAALLLLLKRAGCIPEGTIDKIEEFESHLRTHTQYVPERVELVYQHIIEPGDEFTMKPGFKNFQPIKKGEWLASDESGKIHAQCDGYVLMPLYQDQGNDGFFIVQKQHG